MPPRTQHKIFCAFGAYAVNVMDPAAIVVVPLARYDHADLNLQKRIFVTLDFTKRLGVATWDQALLDDIGVDSNGTPKTREYGMQRPHGTPGIDVLTIGPAFPGPMWGGIYLERTEFFTRVRSLMDPKHVLWPEPNRHAYEYMSSAAWDGAEIRRYHGFHATVRGVGSGGGSNKDLLINGTPVSVDLNDRDQCDDPSLLRGNIGDADRSTGAEPLVTAGSAAGDAGAVFLSLKQYAALGLRSPKEPPGG